MLGQLDRQRSAQCPEVHRDVRDGGEPETLACRAVRPVAEPFVADAEGEPAQQGHTVLGVVMEVLEELRGLVDGFDNDPFVSGSAQGAIPLILDLLAATGSALQRGGGAQADGSDRPAVPSVRWTASPTPRQW